MVSRATPTMISRLVLLKVKDLISVNPVIKNGAIATPPKNSAPAHVILTITLFKYSCVGTPVLKPGIKPLCF